MTEFSTEEVVRQSLRSLVHELAMGLLASKDKNGKKQLVQTKTKSYIRSAEFLRKLYENPARHLSKVISDASVTGQTATVSPKDQRGIIVSYLHEVSKMKPPAVRDWEILRHYLFFFYRQFTSPDPNDDDNPSPPVFFMREIRDVIERLMVEDATQLFLRLFALVREFIQTAQQFFQIDIESEDSLDEEYYFSNMLKYYSALSKAAEGLAPILPELENLLMRKYKVNWLMFNKSLFYHYFYKKSDVKERMKKVRKEMDHPPEPDSPENRIRREIQCIEDCWYMCVLKITSDRESMAMKDPDIVERSLKMMAEHKKILKTNFWLIRSLEQKLVQDMTLLDSQLVLWVGDTEHNSEKLMNWKGQCICEDCMLVEYETGKHLPPFIRLIGCKICYSGVPIGDYISHIIIKHLPAEKKTEFVRKETNSRKKLPNKKLTTKFCKLLAEAAEAVQTEEPPQFKMPPEKRIPENGKSKFEQNFPHFSVSDGTDTVLQNTPDENRETLAGLKLGAEAEDVINAMPEADTFRMMAATLQNMVISKAEQEKAKKNKKMHNVFDEKCCEHMDEAASVVSSSSSSSKTMSRSHASCNHSSCKHVEENQPEDNKKCPYGCDHHKELKKCDCTYCEVFGTSVAMHAHKISETRDRLRSRLNQRKEKFNGVAGTSPYPNANMKNPPKPLATMSKVVVNSSKKLEKTLCPVLTPPRHNSVPRTISEPNMGEESKGQASLPRSLASSKFDSNGLHQSVFSISTCSINSLIKDEAILGDNSDSRDIDELLNYILGNKNVDKVALAQKKAAKKARQRQKREQERLRLEEEEKRKAEERAREEKKREEERLKAEALAKELAERAARKNKKAQNEAKKQQQKDDKKSNKKNKKQKSKPAEREVLIEETIPAMVTIKRVIENDNSPPTVTITLKGSTPDQDKLLYTLVNGYNNNKEQAPTKQDSTQESNKNKKKNKTQTQQPTAIKIAEPVLNVATKKKKNKNGVKIEETTKEVKVTLAVDKPAAKQTKNNENNKKNKTEEKKKQPAANNNNNNNKQKQKAEKSSKPVDINKKEEKDVALNIPMLRLPPGITITKVDGPVNNRNKVTPPPHQPINNTHITHTVPSHHHQHQNSRVPMSKSGVIVVDTEKLIQQSASILSNKKRKKKNKKENAQQQQEQKNGCNGADKAAPSMITLKNPIFHTLQTTLANKVTEKLAPEVPVMSCNQQASIIKNDNGMVTIRSPRLQQSLNNGTPIPNLLTDLKPVIGPEVATCHTNFSDNSRISTLNAQEILSGLPGIEITKVDKKNTKIENDAKKSCQAADVSIIPTTNGNTNDKFSFDRDDWHYESVFTPKDILEDDLDADERELEAFKRFCQQSVPPKRKEKVAHLNVKDIVLIKKNDVTYI